MWDRLGDVVTWTYLGALCLVMYGAMGWACWLMLSDVFVNLFGEGHPIGWYAGGITVGLEVWGLYGWVKWGVGQWRNR